VVKSGVYVVANVNFWKSEVMIGNDNGAGLVGATVNQHKSAYSARK
jgi:hypothetical protein